MLRVASSNEDLIRLAQESGPELDVVLPEGISEACRYAAIRVAEQAEKKEMRVSASVDLHLLRARAMVAAVMTGARATAAGLLLPAFFAELRGTFSPQTGITGTTTT